jgi:hypothetical protein
MSNITAHNIRNSQSLLADLNSAKDNNKVRRFISVSTKCLNIMIEFHVIAILFEKEV